MTHSSPGLLAAQALPPLPRRAPRRIAVWDSAYEVLLGLASDAALADAWGLLPDQVWKRRNELNIPPYRRAPTGITWTAAMLRDLGRFPDTVVAKQYGIAPATVALKRRSRRVCRPQHPSATQWTAAMRARLGVDLDQDIAQRYGLARDTVTEMRRSVGIPRRRPTVIAWERPRIRALLGRASDEVVARRLGTCSETVRLQRTRAGISAFRPIVWTEAIVAQMGIVSDQHLAKQLGCTRSAVGWQRRRLGIAPPRDHRPTGSPDAPHA